MTIETLKTLKKQKSKEEYQLLAKEVLEDLSLLKAKEIYGDVLDAQIVDRLRQETEELSRCCDLGMIADVVEAMNAEKEKGHLYLSRLSQSNSLLFYLLGIGSVNPLPRHAYCPKCHALYWENREAPLCECCEEPLKEDGYDLPFEVLLEEIKRNGLTFDFSSAKSHEHATLPIRYFEDDLIQLATELGFTQKEIEKNDVSWEDTEAVMKCLFSPDTESELSFYAKKYKKIPICNHRPYIGIPDLGTALMEKTFNDDFECYESFDDFVKVVAMIHGKEVVEANEYYVCDCFINSFIGDAIATRDELYHFLMNSQLNKEDALLVYRETCSHGETSLSKLSESKLKEAGVDEQYIDFMNHVTDLFYKGPSVAHTRLAIKVAKIYLEEPLRYYKAYFTLHKENLLKMDIDYDFIKGLSESNPPDREEVYLAAVDLMERGYDPRQLMKEVLNNES